MQLSTEESPASWMVKLFGEVDGGIPEYFSSEKFFDKQCSMKLSPENSSKNITAGFFSFYTSFKSIAESNMLP